MKPAPSLLTVLALALACAVPGAVAAAPQVPPAAVQTPEADGVAQVVTAAELAAWGRERRDAEARRVAALRGAAEAVLVVG